MQMPRERKNMFKNEINKETQSGRQRGKTNNKIQTICGHINLYVPSRAARKRGGGVRATLQVPGDAVGLEKIGKQNHVG